MSEAQPNSPVLDDGSAQITASNVDLSNCDREQVHLVGAIQPHGVLWLLEEPTLRIVQASANSTEFLTLPEQSLAGQSCLSLLGEENTELLRAQLVGKNLSGVPTHLMTLTHQNGRFHLFGIRINGLLLLEFERAESEQALVGEVFFGLRETIQQLQDSLPLSSFLGIAVERIHAFSGFDRVMAYRFDLDGSGEVFAESKKPGLEPYLGLHYPASDIPAPARRLFALSPLRHLPDVDYVPVPLLPEFPASTGGQPVDLSYSFLRSVSPMYTAYLRNMGAKASLVMPLLKEGKLWGLISCINHSGPKYLPYESRVPIEFMGRMVSLLMGNRENQEHYSYRARLEDALAQLISAMARTENFHAALAEGEANLLLGLDADGAALMADGRLTLLGKTPSEHEVSLLLDWLARQREPVIFTHRLAHDFPESAGFCSLASGLLSIRLSGSGNDRVIWFRPEVLREVNWAGDPNKPVEVSEDNQQIRLRPRTSFALWKETVRGQSHRWLDCEIDFATRLRQAIFDVIVERAHILKRANAELERSNLELDSFAYAASHDLKEPLRGIHNFAEFLQREEAERLSETGKQRLETIRRLADRMDRLLESLLQWSRVGRMELDLQDQPIAALAGQTVEFLLQTVPDEAVQIDIQPTLPVVRCDWVQTALIFQNLILNAIKYNDKPVKKIEIGCNASTHPPVFFVRDNGIGIQLANHELIFNLFRRLHRRDEYSGGAGAGLTIAKRAIQRHGGRIWLESMPGAGSTFYFTLANDRTAETVVS